MAAVAINHFAYNFIKIHTSLRMSRAMAAGVTARLLDVSDLVALLVEPEKKGRVASRREPAYFFQPQIRQLPETCSPATQPAGVTLPLTVGAAT